MKKIVVNVKTITEKTIIVNAESLEDAKKVTDQLIVDGEYFDETECYFVGQEVEALREAAEDDIEEYIEYK